MKMNKAKRFCDEYITRRTKSALNNEDDKYYTYRERCRVYRLGFLIFGIHTVNNLPIKEAAHEKREAEQR